MSRPIRSVRVDDLTARRLAWLMRDTGYSATDIVAHAVQFLGAALTRHRPQHERPRSLQVADLIAAVVDRQPVNLEEKRP